MSKAVTVGCKLPAGLICELGRVGDEGYKRVVLNGANSSQIVGGYGLTLVDDEFMAAWMKKNNWLDCVRNKFVFVEANETEASARALSDAGRMTGLEPLNPLATPAGIEPDKEQLAAAKRDNIRQMSKGTDNPNLGLGAR